MKHMAFSLTLEQMRLGTKSVTRRMGSASFAPGDRRLVIEKGQGLKKGEHVRPIISPRTRQPMIIECVSNRPEVLWRLLRDPDYGRLEVGREGFPWLTPLEFVEFFCKANRVDRSCEPNRIEFREVLSA